MLRDWLGFVPLLSENGRLLCPRCGNSYLHHAKVMVFDRPGEDGDGLRVTVNGSVEVKPVASREIPERRDSLNVAFWCEMCGQDQTYYLQIVQHKGETFVAWANA